MDMTYPERHERLQGLTARLRTEIPDTMVAFGSLHQSALVDGALSKRMKELVALSIAIAIRCDGCIAYHVHDALAAGATREEILEIIGVAVLMGGGPALMYGAEAYEALEQFQDVTD